MTLDKQMIRQIYLRYGFDERDSKSDDILVFTIYSGHYDNADIVKLTESANAEDVFSDYKNAGYACKIRYYKSIELVSSELFKGFFTADTIKKRMQKDYEKFTISIEKMISDNAKYEYINSPYTINNEIVDQPISTTICNLLRSNEPSLVIIEAAAGFGKTCAAFEILKNIIEVFNDKVPIFSELSRNRQAKIFRYVLLDEIDRTFPNLSSSLVKEEILNGNIPVILDGFDELLHNSSEHQGYENTEPMLNTIGELLLKNAKVILTTRRTAIFDGDEFHNWMEVNEGKFKIHRIKLSTPSIKDWLNHEQISSINKLNIPIEKISNPVLLAYLRYISNEEFLKLLEKPDTIVDYYIDKMLEREKERQDLKLDITTQKTIIKQIAGHFIDNNCTSDTKDTIRDVVKNKFSVEIENSRKLYLPQDRPTLDEMLNKIISHAFLDKNDHDNKICMVNDFIFGTFISELIIIFPNNEWPGDELFIEPAINATIPRSQYLRETLWDALQFNLEFTSINCKINCSVKLLNKFEIHLYQEQIENIDFTSISIGSNTNINQSIFIKCNFDNCTFNLNNITSTTFVECRFFNCKSINSCNSNENFILDSISNDRNFIESLSTSNQPNADSENDSSFDSIDVAILEKFWPKGSTTFHKHRPISSLILKKYNHSLTMIAIHKLKKMDILKTPDRASFLELNLDKVSQIKEILGR